MKIAVICANGKAGRLIVQEAVKRGLEVTAVVRGENRTQAPRAILKDLFDLTAQDLRDFDVVVDAFGAWTPETLPQHSTSLRHLCGLLRGTDTRLLVVGGAGSLYTDPAHSARLMDGPGFPDAFKPLAASMGQALEELRKETEVKWTYLSPAADFQADRAPTGKVRLAGEEFTVNERGESVLGYADYAAALIDEAVQGKHIQERISVLEA